MSSISRTDRLLQQLRSRIGSRPDGAVASGTPAPAVSAQRGKGDASGSSPLAMVRRLHESGVSDERVLVGRLIEGLLLGELGADVQGAGFQYVVSQVVDTLKRDPESWTLCQACVAEALA